MRFRPMRPGLLATITGEGHVTQSVESQGGFPPIANPTRQVQHRIVVAEGLVVSLRDPHRATEPVEGSDLGIDATALVGDL